MRNSILTALLLTAAPLAAGGIEIISGIFEAAPDTQKAAVDIVPETIYTAQFAQESSRLHIITRPNITITKRAVHVDLQANIRGQWKNAHWSWSRKFRPLRLEISSQKKVLGVAHYENAKSIKVQPGKTSNSLMYSFPFMDLPVPKEIAARWQKTKIAQATLTALIDDQWIGKFFFKKLKIVLTR